MICIYYERMRQRRLGDFSEAPFLFSPDCIRNFMVYVEHSLVVRVGEPTRIPKTRLYDKKDSNIKEDDNGKTECT